ncbi:hypothetical protein ACFTS5_12560 [Nocardia sp. NPDC056952]|uniref:hypothetical protein n=1 Tax=Nocardia sp. NPDC056952 TaxID=3345979 RepID=UPI00363616B0
MLTELDDRVHAAINLHAVLGALPRLAELDSAAAAVLGTLDRDVTLTLSVLGGPEARYTFTPTSIRPGGRGVGPRLLFTSSAHLNAVLGGTAKPIPLGGPAGIRFLTKQFAPLSEILAGYLQPASAQAESEDGADIATLLALHISAVAITVVGNEDVSGKFSAEHMPDGDFDLEVGEDIRYRLEVKDHRLRVDHDLTGSPRAALRFADLGVAGAILSGQDSALACMCDGRLTMRGFVPLIDNANRILDRVGAYLGAHRS